MLFMLCDPGKHVKQAQFNDQFATVSDVVCTAFSSDGLSICHSLEPPTNTQVSLKHVPTHLWEEANIWVGSQASGDHLHGTMRTSSAIALGNIQFVFCHQCSPNAERQSFILKLLSLSSHITGCTLNSCSKPRALHKPSSGFFVTVIYG